MRPELLGIRFLGWRGAEDRNLAFTKQLRELLVAEGLREVEGAPRIERVIRRVYEAAEAGEGWAVQLLFERIDGKVPQSVEGSDGGSCVVLVMRGASMDEL